MSPPEAPQSDDSEGGAATRDQKKKKPAEPYPPSSSSSSSSSSSTAAISIPVCQAESCAADLSAAKRYHRRHKVCEPHFKAPVVLVAGLRQRFCQQCSRFHELAEFDETKRSCRQRLAGHNERRRKISAQESGGKGSGLCRDRDQRSERMTISVPAKPTFTSTDRSMVI